MDCYKFEKLYYKYGLFDKSIDATYILHLYGNGRLESIKNQLLIYHPSKIVYILFNKGFKNCNKSANINTTAIDLVDCNMQIFEHAEKNHYKNILILEDDFIFDEKIKEQQHINNINTFILNHENEKMIYLLGTLPILQIPYDLNTNITYSVGTHSVIYTKSVRDNMLKGIKILDIDEYHNVYSRKYTYYIPLCYQLFSNTDNSLNWGNNGGYLYKITVVYTMKQLLTYLNLDAHIEPGYTYFYRFSKILFWILILLIMAIYLINA